MTLGSRVRLFLRFFYLLAKLKSVSTLLLYDISRSHAYLPFTLKARGPNSMPKDRPYIQEKAIFRMHERLAGAIGISKMTLYTSFYINFYFLCLYNFSVYDHIFEVLLTTL